MSVVTNLPTLDEWMDLRARLTDVFGEQPTKTLLTLLPAPTEGGFATNVRIDQLELVTNSRFDQLELATNSRFDKSEIATTARFDRTDAEVKARFDQFETSVAARFDRTDAEVKARFDQLETSVTARFDKMDDRFDNYEALNNLRFAGVEARFDAAEVSVNARFDTIQNGMEKLSSQFSDDMARQRSDFAKDMAVMGAELRNASTSTAMDAIKASRLLVSNSLGRSLRLPGSP